jgi:hypothetical protein
LADLDMERWHPETCLVVIRESSLQEIQVKELAIGKIRG